MANIGRLTEERRVNKMNSKRGESEKTGHDLMQWLVTQQEAEGFRELHWRGTFQDYLNIVAKDPKVARTAFQRIYDMILSFGTERFTRFKRDYIKHGYLFGILVKVTVTVLLLSIVRIAGFVFPARSPLQP